MFLACTRYKGPLPGPEPTLTVAVTYDRCSSIGNVVFSQEAIPALIHPYPLVQSGSNPRPNTPLTLTYLTLALTLT